MASGEQVNALNTSWETQRAVTTPPGHSITVKNECKERALIFEHLLLQLKDFQDVVDERHSAATSVCDHGSTVVESQGP